MEFSERLPTHLNPMAERTCLSQVCALDGFVARLRWLLGSGQRGRHFCAVNTQAHTAQGYHFFFVAFDLTPATEIDLQGEF